MTILPRNDSNDLVTVLRELIVNRLSVSKSQVLLNADLREDLGADSLDIVELMVSLGQLRRSRLGVEKQYTRALCEIRTPYDLLWSA